MNQDHRGDQKLKDAEIMLILGLVANMFKKDFPAGNHEKEE